MKNETTMRPTIKNRILAIFAALLLGIGILKSFVVFMDFMEHTIYEESTAHLTEIYHQANQTLYNKVSLNWGVMRMWTPYLECAQSDADVRSFLAQAKEEYQFTDFFFVSRDGSYITLDGEQGYLDLGRMLSQLVLEQQPIVANSVVPDKPEIMVFAVPTEKGSYQGFAYEAIAVTYNNKDLVDSLKISAFEGHGSTFAVLPDGRVVLDSSSEDMRGVHNILAMLKNSAGFTAEQITALQKAFAAGKSGSLEFSIHGVSYYMVYGSAAFQNWTILGIAPKSVVNANMNRLQYTTMAVMSSIVGMLAVAVLLLVVQSNRQKLRKKDQQLLAREELFSSLSRNVDDVFLMIDTGTGKVEYISPNVRRILGISTEAVQEDFHVLCSAGGYHCRSRLDDLMQMEPGTQQEWNREFIHQETGEPRYIHVTGFINDAQGAKKCIVDLSDRTGEHQTMLAVEAALEVAEKASKAKTDFLSNMSHDIRTPMNAIVGMTAIAGANINNPERVADCLGKITQSSHHLLGLINEVLDMSRIESGKVVLNEEAFNLAELVDDLIGINKGSIAAHGHSLDVHLHKLEHEDVYGDSLRIQQVITNILSNAIKYTPDGGHIVFSIAEQPTHSPGVGCYQFTVKDNGIGMTPEFQKILFEPFTRADDKRTTKIQGTGLGMAIAQNTVNMMNGTIDVESELGKGSKFTVTIFLKLQNRSTEQIDELAHLPVLVVDDDVLCCESTVEMLQEVGIDGEWTTSGEEAVARAAAHHEAHNDYFAVLVDWKMPGMNGVELTRCIRQKLGKALPIIVLTAYDYTDIEDEARTAGVNDFITKPLFRSRLTAALKNLVAGKPNAADRNELDELARCDYTGKRILLVEDNALNREIAKEIIGMTGVSIECAENGREAVEKFTAAPVGYYDLIFMDIQMPLMNGYETTAAIRAQTLHGGQTIPIVAMTANAFAEDVVLSRNAGMNDHIAKPLDLNKLNDVLQQWL